MCSWIYVSVVYEYIFCEWGVLVCIFLCMWVGAVYVYVFVCILGIGVLVQELGICVHSLCECCVFVC